MSHDKSLKTLTDPFEFWRQFVNKFESDVNAMANRSMGSEQFASTLQNVSQAATGMQQMFDKMLDGYFKALRIPSRQDVTALEERLQRLEDKIDVLLNEVVPVETPGPRRTRKPSSSTEPAPADAGASASAGASAASAASAGAAGAGGR
ncbi:MAG: phasin family protein [Burkholderiaceae bacterium]